MPKFLKEAQVIKNQPKKIKLNQPNLFKKWKILRPFIVWNKKTMIYKIKPIIDKATKIINKIEEMIIKIINTKIMIKRQHHLKNNNF